jgi:hypothetical protein
VILNPEEKTWDTLIKSLEKFSDDFIRTQPETQKREEMIAKRCGSDYKAEQAGSKML